MKRLKKISAIIFTIIIAINACKPKSNKKHNISINTTVITKTSYSFQNPEAETLSIKAFDLKQNKEYSKAISIYKEAIQVEPDNPKLFFDVSECYWQMNMADEAIASLNNAILLDDSSILFYNNLGLIYWQLYQNEKAIENFETAIKLDSTHWIPYSNIAMAYYTQGEQQKACETFNKSKLLGLDEQTIKNSKHLLLIQERCK